MTKEETAAAKKRAYYLANKPKWKESYRRQYADHPEKFAANCAKWRAKNRKHLCERQKKWAAANPEKVKVKSKAYQTEHLAEIRIKRRVYRSKNRDRLRAYFRTYQKQRLETDENHYLKSLLRKRIYNALRAVGKRKDSRTMELIGCDIEFLKGYLEARFQDGMTWKNRGKWHAEHHIPCAEFDLRDPVQQKQCFHYSNLRPMWGIDNIKKGKKMPATHQAELI